MVNLSWWRVVFSFLMLDHWPRVILYMSWIFMFEFGSLTVGIWKMKVFTKWFFLNNVSLSGGTLFWKKNESFVLGFLVFGYNFVRVLKWFFFNGEKKNFNSPFHVGLYSVGIGWIFGRKIWRWKTMCIIICPFFCFCLLVLVVGEKQLLKSVKIITVSLLSFWNLDGYVLKFCMFFFLILSIVMLF